MPTISISSQPRIVLFCCHKASVVFEFLRKGPKISQDVQFVFISFGPTAQVVCWISLVVLVLTKVSNCLSKTLPIKL